MTAITKQEIAALPVEFKLNGKTVVGRADETIIETAKHYGIDIPHLCYKEGLRPDGNCRACVVEIKGERTLAPSCCRTPKDGMEVTTDSARASPARKWCWNCCSRTCRSSPIRPIPNSISGCKS